MRIIATALVPVLIPALTLAVGLAGCDLSTGGDGASAAAASSGPAMVAIELEAFDTHTDAPVVEDASASGGKAVHFQNFTSKATAEVELAAGSYEVVAVANAPDASQDAVGLVVEPADDASGVRYARERVYFDEKFGAYVESSARLALVVPRPGKVKVTVEVTDETGVMVDKVVFKPVD